MLAVPDAITSDSVIWQLLFGTGVEPYMTSDFLTVDYSNLEYSACHPAE